MSETQPILRCGRCNKPFDKESTLKRHGYYCRSRTGGTVPRSRSCIACAKRKARCDNRRPACRACLGRAVECHYPALTTRGASKVPSLAYGSGTPPTQEITPGSSVSADSLSVVNNPVETGDGYSSLPDNLFPVPDGAASTGPGVVSFDWDDPAIDLAEFVDPQATVVNSDDPFPSFLPPTVANELNLQRSPAPFLSLPKQLGYPMVSLVPRVKLGLKTQRTASLILQTLKSYPLMMVGNNTNLPPFIHPRLMLTTGEKDRMEPLHNCASLLHMIGSRVPGSRKLFWRNVRMECERYLDEYLSWDKHELLAAQQALAVYLVIRLGEGETEHNGLDFLIVAAVAAIAKQLGQLDIPRATNDGSEADWDDWIFEESKIRLCVIYQVIDLLVYWEPATMCHVRQTNHLLIAPLPSRKQLWEARDASSWRKETERDAVETTTTISEPLFGSSGGGSGGRGGGGSSGPFALAAHGELVRLEDRDRLGCTVDEARRRLRRPGVVVDPGAVEWSKASWDEWCAGMDGFGGLVMLAASMAA